MPSYTDLDDIVSSEMGDFGSTITFTIVNDQTDLQTGTGNINYYGDLSEEEANFGGAFAHASAIYGAFLNITDNSSSDPYSVIFSDVINVTFLNADAAGNNNNTFMAQASTFSMMALQAAQTL